LKSRVGVPSPWLFLFLMVIQNRMVNIKNCVCGGGVFYQKRNSVACIQAQTAYFCEKPGPDPRFMKFSPYYFLLKSIILVALSQFFCFFLNAQTVIQIGTETNSPSVGVNPGSGANACSPYGTNVGTGANGKKWQAIYTVDMINTAMTAAGLAPGATSFSTVGFNITGRVGSNYTHQGYTVKMANVAQADLSGGYYLGPLTTVYGPAAFTNNNNGWFSLTLSSPFQWDGLSNLCVEVCYTGNTPFLITTYGGCQYTNVGGNNRMGFSGGSSTSCSTVLPGNGSQTNRLTNIRLTAGSTLSLPTITTGTVSPLTYCTGGSISVPFTTSEAFNSGNTFTIQLSNANGSFSAPVSIGSLSGTGSGNISGTIPGGTPVGTGYRVRITGSNPAVTGSANTADISINTSPVVSITSTSATTVCPGGTVSFTASISNGTAIWRQSADGTNFTEISGSGGNSLTSPAINADTWFRVVASNSCGTVESSPVKISVSAVETIQISQSPSGGNLCNGPITLSVPEQYANFTWSNSETGNSIIITEPGNYSGSGTNSSGCNVRSDSVEIIQTSPIVLTTNPSGEVITCGEPVTIIASGGFTDYLWSDGRSGQSVEATQSDTISVTATDTNGCKSTSAEVRVVFDNSDPELLPVSPESPVALCAGESLTLVAGEGYQTYTWSGGETGPQLTVSQPGTYSVSAEKTNGCKAQSALIEVLEKDVPQASFTYEQTSGYLVVFTNTSAGGSSFNWFFGGATTTSENPSFTFNFDGTYPVTLIAENECGSDTVEIEIVVKKLVGIYTPLSSKIMVNADPFSHLVLVSGGALGEEGLNLKIVNVLGQVLVRKSIHPQGIWSEQISVPSANAGIYYLVLENGREQFTHRFLLN
jgi:PKD repeat protein